MNYLLERIIWKEISEFSVVYFCGYCYIKINYNY